MKHRREGNKQRFQNMPEVVEVATREPYHRADFLTQQNYSGGRARSRVSFGRAGNLIRN